jgi:glycosyltransferase involved in cell wall biosynthesis
MSAFSDADKEVEISFVLCPLHKFESGYIGELPDDGIKKIILNDAKKYRFILPQYLLNTFRAALKKYLHLSFQFLDDYMFADGLVCRRAISDVTEAIKKIQPDMVVIEYAVLSKLLTNIPNNIIKVVDTHDRFSDRNKRIRRSGGLGFWMSLSEKQELKLLKRFDFVIAIQRNEGDSFRNLLKKHNSKVETISITEKSMGGIVPVSYDDFAPVVAGFIGSDNKHNKEALEYFIQTCWQKIKEKVPNIQLLIAGTVRVDEIFLNDSSIQHLGKVPSLEHFYNKCEFIINPCMSGSGLKIKSVEALVFGKVLVTTAEGAEGLDGTEDYGVFICSMEDNSLAECCIKLCNDRDKLTLLASKNSEYINNSYEKSLLKIKNILSEKKVYE